MDVFKKRPHVQRSSSFCKFFISPRYGYLLGARYGCLVQDSSEEISWVKITNISRLENRTQHLSFQSKAAFPCIISSKYKVTKDNIIGIDLGAQTVTEEHRKAYIKPS